jgi:MoxR-vWA-beta-propeller ternary system domain bpX2
VRSIRDLTALNVETTLDHVTCARLPASSLGSLALFRRVEEIQVLYDGDQTWVFWENGDARVLRALLPISGVEFYERRGEAWHRPGCRLPSFVDAPDGERVPLSRAVVPEPFSSVQPGPSETPPSWLRLARNTRSRPTTASLCPLAELGRWAELALASEIEAIRGALQDDMALLFGSNLPPWQGAVRYWGHRVLVPIGFEPQPSLPEEALLGALGNSDREILRLVPEGERLTVEAIPLEKFRPLSRAGVRLALGAQRR